MSERTFVMIKPDGVQRGLIGEIIGRFERKGLKIVALKMTSVSESTARRHYAQHAGKPFYEPLIRYITSGPVVCMVWEGPNSVVAVRSLTGATNPVSAQPGSIRGDLALDVTFNVVHASDSSEAALREIDLFFGKDGISGA